MSYEDSLIREMTEETPPNREDACPVCDKIECVCPVEDDVEHMKAMVEFAKKRKCDDCGKPSDSDLCQECCPHDEHDHGICLECGKDIMDDLVGRAELMRDE